MIELAFPTPDLQIGFARKLREARDRWLQDALLNTAASLRVADIDHDLARFVPDNDLRALAGRGLRGELLFAVPSMLVANPRLLGYYRLLLGYSQKEFYGPACGAGRYKSMEERGERGKLEPADIDHMCNALCAAASALLEGVGTDQLGRELLDDLTLLTLGPQLRGGANNDRGAKGIRKVFELLRGILGDSVVSETSTRLVVLGPAGRRVFVELAADPDIVFREQMSEAHHRKVLAIEIKAGTDGSNIHNRLGEAEKSHQKARGEGFVECWTVVNVDRLDSRTARIESPTTNRFYSLTRLTSQIGDEFDDFRRRVLSAAGVADSGSSVPKRSPRKRKPTA
jgi:hypothetical protein